MECTGFSSPRADAFPAGLRVLVVDDDPTWLKILEKMLKRCSYEVTTCGLARQALDLLRERKDGFDIVISDVNMPDMDGFKLLEHVGLEMDLPVIMMSVDGETSRVMKGVQHGACDYLLKPIRMKELRNIWQHVFRKRIHEVRDIESQEVIEEIQMMRHRLEQSNDGYLLGVDLISGKKRKDADNKHEEKICGEPSSVKKARVVWTVDLHQKFVKAVHQIGFDKVGPKKILDLMGVPWLTRENVASHLQKYRLYLSRLQKENELKVSPSGMKQSDVSPKDAAGNVCLPNSIAMQQTNIINTNCGNSGNKIHIHNVDSESREGDMKEIVSMPMEQPKKASSDDITDPQKSSSSKIGINNSSGPHDPDVKYESKIPGQFSWGADVPPIQFKEECEPHFRSRNRFDDLPLPMHHIQVNCMKPSPSNNLVPSTKEKDEFTSIGIKPPHVKSRCQGIRDVTPVETTADLFSVQPESHLTDCHASWTEKNHSLDQILINNLDSSRRNLITETGSAFRLWDEEIHGYSFQGDWRPLGTAFGNIESSGYTHPELIAEVPLDMYDSLRFDYDYPVDAVEYSVVDQGLFIA